MLDRLGNMTPSEIREWIFYPVSLAVGIVLALFTLVGILLPELRGLIGCGSGAVLLAFAIFTMYLFCFEEREKR